MIRLIVGLGNPTSRYHETRHNAGFLFLDRLAEREGLRFAEEKAFQGVLAEWRRSEGAVRLLKPQTYMNRSGTAVRAVAGFYRIGIEEVLVVHDDLDLPVGAVRLKKGGGHGGHNGLRDIVANAGGGDFFRLRLGIGHPGERERVVSYVLERFGKEERDHFDAALDKGIGELAAILRGDFAGAMNRLNVRD
ncbi:MAG TPA: aminoacyl-tRNA hydrolase [Methylococcaceae bacterium]|nr:aminoacyl-tRNA hydrolase [Methylococcaceae bacterium]